MKKFSELPFVNEFQSKDKKNILKYVEAMYDKDSKLNHIENLDERKQEACRVSGLNFEDHPDLINLTKDSPEATLVFMFLSYFQNNNKYHNLQANIQLFWRMQKEMMEAGDDMEKAVKWSKETEQLLNRIDRQMSEIYGSNDVVNIANHEIRKEIFMRTPESRIPVKL